MPAIPGVAVEHRDVVLADGTRLHVAAAGDGPPLVLVHGWPQHWWAWRRLLPALAQERRVLCPDLRGLGWSDAPPGAYAKETWAADLVALLDALDLDSADIAGHDWGGLAALLAALPAPERVRSVAAVEHPAPVAADARAVAARRGPARLPAAARARPSAARSSCAGCPSSCASSSAAAADRATAGRDEELDAYAEVLRDPARARASSAIYRTFLLRELRPLARGRYRGRRLAVPALMPPAPPTPSSGRTSSPASTATRARARAPRSSRAPATFVPEEAPRAVLVALRAHLRRGA